MLWVGLSVYLLVWLYFCHVYRVGYHANSYYTYYKSYAELFVLCPFVLLLVINAKLLGEYKYKIKVPRVYKRWLSKNTADKKLLCYFLYRICFYLPIEFTNFIRVVVREMHFDFSSCVYKSYAWWFKATCKNIWLLNPINRMATLVGQRLICAVKDSKLLFDEQCRLRGEQSNVYFSFNTTFGYLKVIKTSYFDNDGNGVNLFWNWFAEENHVTKTENQTIYKGFIFTKKKAFEVFRLLHEKYPEYFDDMFSLKYEWLLDHLNDALDFINGKEQSDWIRDEFKTKGLIFELARYTGMEEITEKDLHVKKVSFLNSLEDLKNKEHTKKGKQKLIDEIISFKTELSKYLDKLKMSYEK